jgi:hypothetical protein
MLLPILLLSLWGGFEKDLSLFVYVWIYAWENVPHGLAA